MTQLADHPQESHVQAAGRGRITARSIILGLGGVLFVCLLSPYNDLALANTPFVGNYMPVVLLLYIAAIIGINAVASRWWARSALTGAELAVVLAMVLVSCAIPGYGLMRFLPSSLIGLQHHAGMNAEHARTLERLNLPDWLFPASQSNDPVVTDYLGRTPRESDSLADRLRAVPWAAWVRPAAAWGGLLAAVYGAVLCMSVLVRRQWVENERLAFPLATAYAALIEPPPPGRALNTLLSSKGFRIAFAIVLGVHLFNGMHQYWPRHVPRIPLGYNLWDVLTEPPWSYTSGLLKANTLYFSVIGMTYLVPTKIAFSLWGFFLLRQMLEMYAGSAGTQINSEALSDQVFGALVATGAIVLWVGRQHLALVALQMWRGPRNNEPQESYLSYRVAGWGFVACSILITLWLIAAGMTVTAAIVLVLIVMLTFLVMARVIAETGLIFATIGAWYLRPWAAAGKVPWIGFGTTTSSLFWTNWINHLTIPGLRESLPVYATHALCVNDRVAPESSRSSGRILLLLLAMSLLVGYLAAGASTLYVEYNYGSTLATPPQSPLNSQAIAGSEFLLSAVAGEGSPVATGARDRHNAPANIGIGAAVTLALGAARLRWAWWPLHPVGYLLWQSYPLAAAWFSIFMGWLVKVLIVRFGGAAMFDRARPVFLGMVVGEAGAAALWMLVSLVLSGLGMDYRQIMLLPGG